MLLANQINVKLDLGAADADMDPAQGRSFWEIAGAGVLVNMSRINKAVRPDFVLDGWYTADGIRWEETYPISREYCDRDADGNVLVTYDPDYRNNTYTLTLRAKWTADFSAKVVYDLNGGTGEVSDSASYPFHSTVNVSGTVPTPPDGQMFVGWLDAAGTLHSPGGSFLFSDTALRALRDGESVIALTAQYLTPGSVTITFDTDGGNAVVPVTGDAGTPVEPPKNPVKTGYTFTGWDQPLPDALPETDLTLTAKWEVNRYTLTFDTGRGTAVEPVTQEYGTAVSVPEPVLEGHTFTGWDPELPEAMPAEDRTLTAKWTPNRYTITFDTDGGSNVESVTDIYGAWIAEIEPPVREGYFFDGWEPELPASMPAGDMTVTARWRETPEEPAQPDADAVGYRGVYDGQFHSITVNAPEGASVVYRETESSAYSVENPAYRDAGEYTVYYQVTREGAAVVTGSAAVRILKAGLLPELTLVDRHDADRTRDTWVYHTDSGIPKLTVRREAPLVLSPTLMDSGIVTDYGTASYRFMGDDNVYRAYSDEETALLPVGDYTLRVDIPESRNYNAAFAEAAFHVTKAPHEDVTVGPLSVAAGAQGLMTDLSGYLEDEAACAVAGVSGDLIAPDSAAMAESGTALRFDTLAGGSGGAVRLTVSSRNYQDYTITVRLAVGTVFTLRFDSNGGSAVTASKTLRAGNPVGALPAPTRDGYTFAGWYAGAETRFTEQTLMPGADTTLTARWTPNSYTVTLRYLYGGLSEVYTGWTAVEGSNSETWRRAFSADSADFTLPEPIRNGYVFLGWRDETEKTSLSVTVSQGTARDLTYDAVWKIGERHGEVNFVGGEVETGILGFVDTTDDGRDPLASMRAIAAADETVVGADQTKNVKAELYGKPQPNLVGSGDRKEQDDIYNALKPVYGNDDTMKVDYIDIQVNKTVTAITGDSMEHDVISLHETPTVEVPLRYDLTGRYNLMIARCHNGKVLLFHGLKERPAEIDNLDGYYYVSGWGSNAVIYIYSTYFSTFSVATSGLENYRVNFETDGGTWIDDQILPTTGARKATQPTTVEKSGYTFNGWYTLTADGREQNFDFDTAVTGNTTLYARWKSASASTPRPSGGGGGGGGGSSSSVPSVQTPTVPATNPGAANPSVDVTPISNDSYTTGNPAPPSVTGVSDYLVTDSHPVYIRGFSDGTSRPQGYVTRAQVAMMFYRLLKNQDVAGTVSFRDMTGEEWYAEVVYTLAKLGIVQGYSDGSFHGNDTITRAAFTAMACRFLKSDGRTLSGSARFSDVPDSHWAHEVIARTASYGWIGGYDDGTFRPSDSITRAAVTAIINRMLGRSADTAYVTAHAGELNQFSDVQDAAAWYYYNVAEASNEHQFTVSDGKEHWK